ncbi:MAG: cytochrome C oxidase subunit I [Chlorobi bacterium]|nr:cytochrome C oxidase subunit I [Chlorobiota bacterium]
MQSLNTTSAPHSSVVIPHYIFAALSFFILAFLIIISNNSLIGHYFQPKLLAITHVATLGWGTMTIFGALYQLLPVISSSSLFSEKLAKTTFYVFGLGIILLVISFWKFSTGSFFIVSASVVFTAFLLFSTNILLTIQKSPKKDIETISIAISAIWLILTGLLGLLLVINFTYPIFKQSHFLFLTTHAHLGIIGWFLFLIMGASAKLVPMFLISHQLNRKKLHLAFYSVNLSLILFSLNWMIFHIEIVNYIAFVFILVGIISFITYLYESYKKRVRKVLDIGMKHTAVAFIAVILPLILGFISIYKLNFNTTTLLQIIIAYGFTVLLGTISSLILGQTYKTLPFIVWLAKYQKFVGKAKTPLPKEIYSEKILVVQYIVYLIAVIVLTIGILLSSKLTITTGAVFLLVTAILFNINVFKILLHKPKIEIKA